MSTNRPARANPTGNATVDPDHLRRALHLEAERLAFSTWRLGNWSVDDTLGCNCPDRTIRGATCKHEIRVRLHDLDTDILTAIRELTR